MFPFWDVAIAPVLEAAGVRRVVEIGALRGENTVQMLERLGPDVELHVIDPVPAFDPAEHEAAFGGQYVFHQALSLDVLPSLPPMDAALIDGDHNWYTVYHELKALAEVARAANRPLPVMFLHDVGWPYARRDLYYAPEQIPDEFRQPHRKAGMRLGRRKLFERGSLNPTMDNAEVEGGPRNGVMTAIDDFIAEYDRPLRLIEVPVYFGLAIIVEEAVLAETPAIEAALDQIESADGRLELMKMTEDARLRSLTLQHHFIGKHAEELAAARRRTLRLLKSALLNEIYLEHEVAIEHLANRSAIGQPPFGERLRDPKRHDMGTYRRLHDQRFGPAGPDSTTAQSFLPYTAMGQTRLDHLESCLDDVRAAGVGGDLVECGTGRGGGAVFMRSYLDIHDLADPNVWVIDEFRASDGKDPVLDARGIAGFQADLDLVRDAFDRFDVLDDRVAFVQGRIADVLPEAPIGQIAMLRVGLPAIEHTRAVLDVLYDRVVEGGHVIVSDDETHTGSSAVEAFRSEHGITGPVHRVDAGTIAWRKTEAARVPDVIGASGDQAVAGPPLLRAPATDEIDLSVVVVFYNMKREAARTLRSLSRAYQRDIDDVRYEVLVIDNGSSPDQVLGREWAESHGPEFRYIELTDEAQSSPVFALNAGIEQSRGEHVVLMIDGAHVLTPGVLRYGLDALRTYAPSVVATQQWYVGPGQQGDVMTDGYDQTAEDQLFRAIEWPSDGYRLFEISHFIGERDWLDGLWESNCIFVPRSILAQVGGFDPDFSMAGGGYANLEIWERLGSTPGVNVATMIGEGSFHQVHGGTTTNQTDADERRTRIFGYGQHYAERTGKAFRGPGKPIHYVGQLWTPAAKRSKPRRLTATAFFETALLDVDKMPDQPSPVPDDLRAHFTESVWRNLPWRSTTWLGTPIDTAPTDLLAYQEIIERVRPDLIIETGTGDGGRALFLASMCELVGTGRVVSVDREHADDLPTHDRLEYRRGRAHQDVTIERVTADIGPDESVLVIIGTRGNRYETTKQFEAYSPFVPVGSYVVITDTVVNGNPVWAGFGPGPAESLRQILAKHGDFAVDPLMEKYSLTFNPRGFLHRVR